MITRALWRLMHSPGLAITPHIHSKCRNLVKVKSKDILTNTIAMLYLCSSSPKMVDVVFIFLLHHELVFQWIQRKGPMEKSADSREHFTKSRTVSFVDNDDDSFWNLPQYHEQISRPLRIWCYYLWIEVTISVFAGSSLFSLEIRETVSSVACTVSLHLQNHDTPSRIAFQVRSYPPEYDLFGIFWVRYQLRLNIEFIYSKH